MSKSWNRAQIWVGLIVVAVGGLITAILALFMYFSVTSTPLHPERRSVPSVTRSDPSRKWADAVERGRQIMRTGLSERVNKHAWSATTGSRWAAWSRRS